MEGDQTRIAWEYDSAINTITSKKDMNYKREDFGVAYDQDEQVIYVLGGYSYGMFYDSAMANCEKYSIKDDKWTEIKPMSTHK